MASSVHAQLSTLITSPSDLKRARRELETVDDFLHQAGLRTGGKVVKLPQTSHVLDELVSETNANLLKATDRAQLIKYLNDLAEKAPVLHMSFASEPSVAFMNKLTVWLRGNIHPQVMVSVGLQPSIAAGCVLRTANKQYDFSLTKSFDEQRGLLVSGLKEVTQATPSETKKIEIQVMKEIAQNADKAEAKI